jgi:hypothetical protein
VFKGCYPIIDLSFEEGTVRIGVSAFSRCPRLAKAAFPASLTVIEANAFWDCKSLSQITFAAGSQLQYIRIRAFSNCPLKEFVVPASIVKIDPSAFTDYVWRSSLKFEGPPLFSIDAHFICSADLRELFGSLSPQTTLLIGWNIEMIGANSFRSHKVSAILFEFGSRLREIGCAAFADCSELREFRVPESVEILGDRCFECCSHMETIDFEGSSRLKMIGERAFAGCKLHSITIPALTEEIDGSAFVDCLWLSIQVAPGSLNFKVEGTLLVTFDGTAIVRYFGVDREIVVGKNVKALGKSCFEGCKDLDRIYFEAGSELEQIGRSAVRDCESLSEIEIPASVSIIDKSCFEGCRELESCLMDRNSSVVRIGDRAFAKCILLRSFNIPARIDVIGRNCFTGCICLYRVMFRSSDSLRKFVGDRSLDDALEGIGLTASSGLFRIDLEDERLKLKFAGWSYGDGGEGLSELSLVRDLQ